MPKNHRSIVIFFFVGNYRELIEYLNGTSDLLAKNGNILDNVLETLDVQQHSLGVLYVLVAKFTNLSVCCTTNRKLFCIDLRHEDENLLKYNFSLFCIEPELVD